MPPSIELRHYVHDDLPQIRQTLLDVHSDAYADQMHDPFVRRFDWFVDRWGGNPGFSCVLGYDGAEPVGFAYGAPSAAGAEWWREHLDTAPLKSRTFALSELMVRPRWRKTGISRVLHHGLLNSRHEDIAVLTVDVTHPKVQSLYESWGYRKIGENKPFPDSPLFAVMFAELPL